MEIPVYDYGRGDLLCTILVDEKDNFCVLKEKVQEKEKIKPKRQTIVLRIEDDTAGRADLQLDEELEKWPVSEAVPKCQIFVKLPFAAEEAETNAVFKVVMPPENQVWTLRKGQRFKLPSSGELNLLQETKETRHQVLQFKDERPGKFFIENEDGTCKVYYVPEGGEREEVACELKTLDEIEKESWTQTGERLKRFIVFNVELSEIVARPAAEAIKVCASVIRAFSTPGIQEGIAFLQILLGAMRRAIQTP